MKNEIYRAAIRVKISSIGGHGVFAEQNFEPGDLIEECRTLLVPEGVLHDYVFNTNDACGIALGYGSLYNHGQKANARYHFDANLELLIFEAQRPIKAGEEILINYGETWFSKRMLRVKYPFIYRLRKILSSRWRRPLLFTLFLFLFISILSLRFPA